MGRAAGRGEATDGRGETDGGRAIGWEGRAPWSGGRAIGCEGRAPGTDGGTPPGGTPDDGGRTITSWS
jgi:hypothetical protein